MSYTVCSIEKRAQKRTEKRTEKRTQESEDLIIREAEANIIYQEKKGHYDRELEKYIIDECTDKPLFAKTSLTLKDGEIEEVSFTVSENSYFKCLDRNSLSEYKVVRQYWNYGSPNSFALEEAGDNTFFDCFDDMAKDLLRDDGITVEKVTFTKRERKMDVNINFWGSGSSDITDRIESDGKVYIVKSRLEADDILLEEAVVCAYARGPFTVSDEKGEEIESYDEIWEAVRSPFFKVFLEQRATAMEDMEGTVQAEVEDVRSNKGGDADLKEELGGTSISYEVEEKELFSLT